MKVKFCILMILFLLASCGRDLEQAQKYADFKSEIESQIQNIDLIIKDQKAIYDSAKYIFDGFLRVNAIPPISIELSNIQDISIDIDYKMKQLKLKLETYQLWCSILEKANKKLIYLRRQKIISMHIKDIQDLKNEIEELTGGITVGQYLSNYLPKDVK